MRSGWRDEESPSRQLSTTRLERSSAVEPALVVDERS